MGSVLLVANQTLGGEALGAHLRRMFDADPNVRFVVVVPLSTPVLDLGGAMGAMSGITLIDPTREDRLRKVAQARLATALTWLRDAGFQAEGSVVGDPIVAIDQALASQTFDEIVLATPPAHFTRWFRQDLAHRATRRFAVPVTAITVHDDTLPSALGVTERSGSASTSRDGGVMAESVYKIIELVGTSTESWEKAAAAAVLKASRTLRDLRVAEVVELDLVLDNGAVSAYRAKVKVSFKYEDDV